MAKDLIHTVKDLPIAIHDQQLVKTKAEIFHKPDSVLVQIVASGPESQLLAEYLEQWAPIGLTFSAVPAVRAVRE